jgi:hypothetical protein
VTDTRSSIIPVGTILTAINGQSTERMTPLELRRHFNNREVTVVPTFRTDVSVPMDISDCAFHRFVAIKSRSDRPSIVTESNDSAIPIGTILTAINGLSTERMTPLELSKHFNSRERKVVPKFRVDITVTTGDSDLHSDQVSFSHNIDLNNNMNISYF